jgi:hypothetical protein
MGAGIKLITSGDPMGIVIGIAVIGVAIYLTFFAK